jgi:alkanesulfonate monooxygenase SsuD/methylene tetrahydromethanopterin reductase-like flavin-dependent oxidoreductase (luciferase family)
VPRPVVLMDLRCPEYVPITHADLYGEALEMLAWCDEQDWYGVFINEHHAADDGYLPAPVTMASAIAARTKRLELRTLLIAPFYDPLRLAEDLAIVDNISLGRIAPVLAAGYRPFEFDMFGVSLADRRARLDETFRVLREAWTGEPFRYRGRTARVRPTPYRDGGPPLAMGGSTKTAARHAADIADDFYARGDELWDTYRKERLRLGKPDPGPYLPTAPGFLMVSEDPERTLHQVYRNIMAWNNSYNDWFHEAYGRPWGPALATIDDVRAVGDKYMILTPTQTVKLAHSMASEAYIGLRPLCGGMDPELSWESLRLFTDRVMPQLQPSR